MLVVRYVGPDGCAAAPYIDALADERALIVDSDQVAGNVTVRFRLDGQPLRLSDAPEVRDLVDFGALIYCADEHLRRKDQADGWTRAFRLVTPVRDPVVWKRASSSLMATLSFLSGDRYSAAWYRRADLQTGPRHRATLPREFDTVCLFSGGLDSFVGAAELLETGRRLILVGHQAEGITAAAQVRMADLLRRQFPGRSVLVQSRVARSLRRCVSRELPRKVERSHRARSFLFLSIGCAIALSAGVSELAIPENGLIALNCPLQPSRLGTNSTRTAHPVYLGSLLEWLRASQLFEGTLVNPLQYRSKTDVASAAPRWARGVLRWTVSCAHPDVYRWRGRSRKLHCGYCVPCIYRRVALRHSGLDRASDYVWHPFTRFTSVGPTKRADLTAVVNFARRVAGANRAERHSLVHSAGWVDPRVVSGLSRSTDPIRDLADMLSRWSSTTLEDVRRMCTVGTRRLLRL